MSIATMEDPLEVCSYMPLTLLNFLPSGGWETFISAFKDVKATWYSKIVWKWPCCGMEIGSAAWRGGKPCIPCDLSLLWAFLHTMGWGHLKCRVLNRGSRPMLSLIGNAEPGALMSGEIPCLQNDVRSNHVKTEKYRMISCSALRQHRKKSNL